MVKALVHARAEVDAPNRYGRTPLYEAAWYGHFQIAYWLWRQGASKYTLDRWGEQAAFVRNHPPPPPCSPRPTSLSLQAYQTPKEIAHWLNKEREGRDDEPDPVFPGLCSSDEEGQ